MQQAWATLLDRADVIADDITFAMLEREKEWYDGVGPELRAEIRESTREHVRRGIRTMSGTAEPGRTAIDVWRETGSRRARQGVPMEQVLNAYSLGARVLWEALIAQRDNPHVDIDDEVLLLAGQRIWSALDVQNATMIDAYRRESARRERRDLQRQQRLLDGLVDGRGDDPTFAAEVREVLGFASDEPVACVASHFDGSLDAPLRSPEDHLERQGLLSAWHVRGDVHFGIVRLSEGGEAGLVAALGPVAGARVGVATANEGIAGFRTAYHLAVRTARTLDRGEVTVATVVDRLPEVLLEGSPEVTSILVREALGPLHALPEHQTEVLIDTLRALLAHDGSPTRAAEELYCHRNTVIYRMRQIEEVTRRRISNPRDRLLFDLALLASRHPYASGKA
jgi:hypothetical protein